MLIPFVCWQLILGQLKTKKFVTRCLNPKQSMLKHANYVIKLTVFVLTVNAVMEKCMECVLF